MAETMELIFEGVHEGTIAPLQATVDVTFGELGGISEAMIIGFPTLAKWGYALDADADGNIWVELRKLGITMLAEGPVVDA